MAKEYQTLTFADTSVGRKEMGEQIDQLANAGWEMKSKEVTQQGWDAGKTACLGLIFLPLALLGKKENVIQVIMEREKVDEKPSEKDNKSAERAKEVAPESGWSIGKKGIRRVRKGVIADYDKQNEPTD